LVKEIKAGPESECHVDFSKEGIGGTAAKRATSDALSCMSMCMKRSHAAGYTNVRKLILFQD
jgi:hypothetical protein